MRPKRAILSRADTHAAAIVRAWRGLVTRLPVAIRGRPRTLSKSGAKTLVACSGGADSVALVLALGAATDQIVVGHVVHDLRPRKECLADRDVVRALAERMGLEFAEAEVSVRGPGEKGKAAVNLEAGARQLRYKALRDMAAVRQIGYVAAAHHADDQLETMLMGLMRGVGLRGLAAIPEWRRLGRISDRTGVLLIRPMLAASATVRGGITREVCRAMCEKAGVEWREDPTNEDVSLLRAAVRHEVVPTMKRLRPGVSAVAVSTAKQVRDALRVVEEEAGRCFKFWEYPDSGGVALAREVAARKPDIVVGEVVREMYFHAIEDLEGLDALTSRALAPIVRAIKDDSGEKREFRVGKALVRVQKTHLSLSPIRKGKK